MVHCAGRDTTICIQNKWVVEVEVELAAVIYILVDLVHFPAQGLLLPRGLGFAPPTLENGFAIEISTARAEPLFQRL